MVAADHGRGICRAAARASALTLVSTDELTFATLASGVRRQDRCWLPSHKYNKEYETGLGNAIGKCPWPSASPGTGLVDRELMVGSN